MASAPPLNPQIRDDILRMFEPPYKLSMGAIAERHQLTRSQVAGVIARAAAAGDVTPRRAQEPGEIRRADGGTRPFTPRPPQQRRRRPSATAPTPAAAEPEVELPPPPRPVTTVFRPIGSKPCCWPMWPAQPKGQYCEAPSLPGRPYCDEHTSRSLDHKRMEAILEHRRRQRAERRAGA